MSQSTKAVKACSLSPRTAAGAPRSAGIHSVPELPATAAAEPLNPHGDHLLLLPVHDNGKLSHFDIVPGKISTTGRAGIAGIEQYVIIGCQCSLDNIREHGRDAAFSHEDAPVFGIRLVRPDYPEVCGPDYLTIQRHEIINPLLFTNFCLNFRTVI